MTIQWLICEEPVHIGGADSDSRGNNNPIYRLPDRAPAIPGSALRGALRQEAENDSSVSDFVNNLFGKENDAIGDNKTGPGQISIGWGWVLWFPVHVLGFGSWWVTCPKWLNYYQRLSQKDPFNLDANQVYSTDPTLKNQTVYLRWLKLDKIQHCTESLPAPDLVPKNRRLIVPDESINLFVDMGLVRQPRVSLSDEPKQDGSLVDNLFSVEGLPPGAVFFFAWTQRKSVNNLSDWEKFLTREHYLGGLWSIGYGRIKISKVSCVEQELNPTKLS